MSFFPILLDLDGLPCLVAGGGRLGLHKAKLLLESGADTVSDITVMVQKEVALRMQAPPGNRDYGAFYDAGGLPAVEDVLKALKGLPSGLVYGDFESVLYRAFTDMSIPTKLLQKT